MTAKTALGSAAHSWRMGTAKAMVLPLPVREPPIHEREARMGGMQAVWMRVGVRIERCEREVVSQGATPREGKLVGLEGVEAWGMGGAVSLSMGGGGVVVVVGGASALGLDLDLMREIVDVLRRGTSVERSCSRGGEAEPWLYLCSSTSGDLFLRFVGRSIVGYGFFKQPHSFR